MIKRIFAVLLGTAVAQLINISATLLLVQMVAPDAFGRFVSWLAYVSVCSILISLRLEVALVNESNIEQRNQLVTVIVKVVTIICISGSCLLTFVYVLDIWYISAEYLLLFAMCFFSIMYQLLQNYLALLGDIKRLNILRVLNVLSFSALQLLFASYNPSVFSLSLAYMLGFLLSLLVSGGAIYKKVVYYWNKVSILSYLRKHRNYLRYSLPADFINTLSTNMSVILIGYKYGAVAAGTLGLAVRFLGAPVALLSKAVLDIYKKDAMQAYAIKQQFINEYRKTFLILFGLSICISISVIVLVDPFIAFFMNDVWLSVATVIKYLLIMFCVQFIASPLSYAVYITHNQKIDLIWQIVLIVVTFCSIWFMGSFYMSLLAYSIGLSLLYMVYILISYKLAQGRTLC